MIRLVMAVAALSWPAAQAAEKEAKMATLSGVVLNLASGGLLPEATVVIRELGVMTKTDLDGLYQFEVPEGRYTLIVGRCQPRGAPRADLHSREHRSERL